MGLEGTFLLDGGCEHHNGADLNRIKELESRLSAAEKERDEVSNQLLEKIEELNQAIAWGEKLKAKLRDAMGWNWLDDDIEQHCDVEAFRRLIDDPAPAALSHLRQEIRREAIEDAAKVCELFEHGDGKDFAREIRRLSEEAKEQEWKNG